MAWAFVLGCLVGAFFGVLTMALLMVGRRGGDDARA
jgi:hypothetical protein